MAKPQNIDQYLNGLEGNFAHPILTRVREIIHENAPQVQENIKWGSPSFEYKGLMMSMIAFKNFAAVWFHKGAILEDPKDLLEASTDNTKAMRKYVIRDVEDLDEQGLADLVREAVAKNDSGEEVKGMGDTSARIKRSEMLDQALTTNDRARETYESLSESRKREYAEHIESAKQIATKQRRLQKAMELLEQGLGLNDQYRS